MPPVSRRLRSASFSFACALSLTCWVACLHTSPCSTAFEGAVRALEGSACRLARHTLQIALRHHRARAGLPMTSPRCYSASFTDDMHQAVGALHAAFPAAPLLAAGYSLGALILTKYLAEVDQGHWPASEGARSAACAACPLFDLGGAPPQAARSDHSYMRMLLRRVSVAGEGDFRR